MIEHNKNFYSLEELERTREQDIAMKKLEEAVFWLTYSLPEDDE